MRWVSIGVLSLLALCYVAAADGVVSTQFTECGNCEVDWLWYASSSNAWTTLLLTTDKGLYFSADEGTTWTKKLDGVLNIHQSEVNSAKMVIEVGDKLFVTTNGGLTITQTNPPTLYANSTTDVYLHPHLEDTFMIDTYNRQNSVIYYTTDFGTTWKNFAGKSSSIYKLAWSQNRNSTNTIFALDIFDSFKYTNNYGSTYTDIFSANVIDFLVTDHHVWVAAENVGKTTLYISARHNDASHTDPYWYLEAEFPFGDTLPQTGYTILEDVSNQGFLGLISNARNWGSVYVSEYEGASWVLSLDHAARYGPTFDFDRVGGIRGIAIANTISNYQQASGKDKTTMITFDNGGEWRYLKAPATDSNGVPFPCSGSDCRLNLHGLTSYYDGTGLAPFYSSSNAIGLIVALGNVGPKLSKNVNELSTFLSRDNGLTWFEIDVNPTIYEFGDHGGILVWARTDQPTNVVYYSLDEGLTVNNYTFSNVNIDVENIITELGGPGRKFILYGEKGDVSYIFGLDFTGLQPRACEDADYEYYSPDDGLHGGQHCLLGRTTLYLRRKREAQCYNDRDTDHRINTTACACTYEDYECDWQFEASERDANDAFTCTTNNNAINTPPTFCNGTYTYKTGYRLIEEDGCVGGLQIGEYQAACPTSTGKSTTGGSGQNNSNPGGHNLAIVVGVLVSVAVVAIIGLIIWRKPTVIGNFFGLFRSKDNYSSVSQVADDEDDGTA